MKIHHNFHFLILTLFLSLFFTHLSSQPVLTGLNGNPQLIKEAKKEAFIQKEKVEYENVKLPFFDDFSYNSPYPDPALWLDRQAFVNSTYPIRPPSIGVVTLDALNEFGEVYAHAQRVPFPADTLTSRPIRLDSIFNPYRSIRISDSLYFSFYYQPGGGKETLASPEWERIGNAPDRGDFLVLEFGYNTGDSAFYDFAYTTVLADSDYYPGDSIPSCLLDGTYYYFTTFVQGGTPFLMPCDSLFKPVFVWNEVWRTDGCKLDDWLRESPLTYFKQVMIPIVDEDYLRNNFQFRFRNYASLEDQGVQGWASNVDQWHIDYVMLNVNRRANDLYPNDVAFVSPTTSILEKYQAMPWNQFKPSDLKSTFHNKLANISSITKTTRYGCIVTKNETEVGRILFSEENADPYYNNGLHTYSFHANPRIEFTLPYDASDSACFVITHVFEVVGEGDACRRNDTCEYIQKFYNYYAYDDGTAEAGLTLLSTMPQPHTYFAMRFNLNEKDSLRAIRMWFNRVLNDANIAPFTLKVWAVDNDGLPGEVLYSQEALMPRHESDYFDFTTYFLDKPVKVSGSFFVGFYQNHRVQLNIGFDQNNDAYSNVFSKTTNIWEELPFKGAPMIRPVMGKFFSSDIPEYKENEKRKWTVYPNPTTGQLTINNEQLTINNVSIFDIMGRNVYTLPVTCHLSLVTIDISHLPAGIYFIRFFFGNQSVKTTKIIKQ